MKEIQLFKIRHRGEERIQVLFSKDADIISKIKTISGRRWNKTKNCWHLPYSVTSFNALKNLFGESRLNYENKKEPRNTTIGNLEPEFATYPHKFILLLIYFAGLRLSEIVNIRIRDINHQRRTIFIKAGKGKKDRYVTLAEAAIPYLKKYLSVYAPAYWLLEGVQGGQYSSRSVRNLFRTAVEKSKINAYATVHTLRHSYATHCIENGFSTALVQQALGHQSLKTTERYLHVSSNALRKLKSPVDIIQTKRKTIDNY